ncbi:uncharacterized protein mwh isoform X1 [Tribolium castaneum]|uniref:uncharacterized protein mwh isoform X1 n=1 Tax=Tribolium castaneum TaxID=7070 RepID=UPI0030FEDD97
MGNSLGSDGEENGREGGNRVWFFLHRTWTLVVAEKWKRNRRSEVVSDFDSQCSQYSFCSCEQCQRDDGFSSGCDSELFGSGSSMAPNSEESARIGQFPFGEEAINKEKQRPPIYNPEDYVLSLKKWGRKPTNGNSVSLYPTPSSSDSDCSRSQSSSFRDYRNPMLISSGSEMTLRQFGTVGELLAKLKSDLRLAYPSFVQEFVADPLDGITLLLDLLRAIQLSQSSGTTTTGKIPPSLQRRALLDELSCLQCLLLCCQRYNEAVRKLTSSSAGLFTLAICIMSNVTKSRILALQLLTKACNNGHSAVSEALATLRLRFGEPVRFRFLVGMLMSAGGQGELLVAGMKFLNTFLDTSGTMQKRIYIQAELEQAGFDIATIKKQISINSASTEQLFEELDHWEKKFLDVESLSIRLENTERENDSLRDKVLLLERRVQILLEEKGILISLEQCLKERCSELQEEVHSLKSEKSQKNSSCGSSKKKEDSPHEDEGISSSERSLTPDEVLQRESSVYELYNVQNPMMKKPSKIEEEDETTIDEVIEELRNIINDAETETYRTEEKKKLERKKIEEAQVASKIQMTVAIDDFSKEIEIVPSNLHPQPPRRTKSLVHLFIPAEDYDYGNKELFFENETPYTSEEGSDSLLSASKYQLPRVEKGRKPVHRSESFRQAKQPQNPVSKQNSFDGGYFSVGVVTEDSKKIKSKSLDRIDDGLETLVDIVVTAEHEVPKPESLLNHQKKFSDEKMKMFLPKRDNDVLYYFPRIQERKNNTFLARGHNAGLYSGQVTRQNSVKKPEFVSGNNRGKVTDLPSGLY